MHLVQPMHSSRITATMGGFSTPCSASSAGASTSNSSAMHYGVLSAWRTLIDFITGRNGFGVGPAAGVAAPSALGLREYFINGVDQGPLDSETLHSPVPIMRLLAP